MSDAYSIFLDRPNTMAQQMHLSNLSGTYSSESLPEFSVEAPLQANIQASMPSSYPRKLRPEAPMSGAEMKGYSYMPQMYVHTVEPPMGYSAPIQVPYTQLPVSYGRVPVSYVGMTPDGNMAMEPIPMTFCVSPDGRQAPYDPYQTQVAMQPPMQQMKPMKTIQTIQPMQPMQQVQPIYYQDACVGPVGPVAGQRGRATVSTPNLGLGIVSSGEEVSPMGPAVSHSTGLPSPRPTVSPSHAISPNAISPNAISPNAISPNAISPHAISPPAPGSAFVSPMVNDHRMVTASSFPPSPNPVKVEPEYHYDHLGNYPENRNYSQSQYADTNHLESKFADQQYSPEYNNYSETRTHNDYDCQNSNYESSHISNYENGPNNHESRQDTNYENGPSDYENIPSATYESRSSSYESGPSTYEGHPSTYESRSGTYENGHSYENDSRAYKDSLSATYDNGATYTADDSYTNYYPKETVDVTLKSQAMPEPKARNSPKIKQTRRRRRKSASAQARGSPVLAGRLLPRVTKPALPTSMTLASVAATKVTLLSAGMSASSSCESAGSYGFARSPDSCGSRPPSSSGLGSYRKYPPCKIVRGLTAGASASRPPKTAHNERRHYVPLDFVIRGVLAQEACLSPWSPSEQIDRRRIIRIERSQAGATVNAVFLIVGLAYEHPEVAEAPEGVEVVEVSCLECFPLEMYHGDESLSCNYYITSVEVVSIVELLVGMTEMDPVTRRRERGRIRSNLMPFWLRKPVLSKKQSEQDPSDPRMEFARRIVSYNVRKPRGFDKDVRILRWDRLIPALQRALQCYYVDVLGLEDFVSRNMET